MHNLDNTTKLTQEKILEHFESLAKHSTSTDHEEILLRLADKIEKVDFREGLDENEHLKGSHFRIRVVEELQSLSIKYNWGLCQNNRFIYIFNGASWKLIDQSSFRSFLGESAEKMSVKWDRARDYAFRKQLFDQFIELGNLQKPNRSTKKVLINLLNGTFEITSSGHQIRDFNREDFLTYQLPFNYDRDAMAPIFTKYLDRVLPDTQSQDILAEFIAYVFIPSQTLKLEKVLLLYGSGANGKSVFFDIISALIGAENISNFSLQSLTEKNTGYYRAMIQNKLINYASEINSSMETSFFKSLASGEPVEARLPYGEPFQISNYAKLIFNCNELPRDVEHSNAFYRRFLIVPFNVTIPESEQDVELSKKIISLELSGIFNWVLDGLDRLLKEKKFTKCDAANHELEIYRKQSDSVGLFLDDREYTPSPNEYTRIKDLYDEYRVFCIEDGFKPLNKSNFIRRLGSLNINVGRRNIGNIAYLEKGIPVF